MLTNIRFLIILNMHYCYFTVEPSHFSPDFVVQMAYCIRLREGGILAPLSQVVD